MSSVMWVFRGSYPYFHPVFRLARIYNPSGISTRAENTLVAGPVKRTGASSVGGSRPSIVSGRPAFQHPRRRSASPSESRHHCRVGAGAAGQRFTRAALVHPLKRTTWLRETICKKPTFTRWQNRGCDSTRCTQCSHSRGVRRPPASPHAGCPSTAPIQNKGAEPG
jgi:hypothetical protein